MACRDAPSLVLCCTHLLCVRLCTASRSIEQVLRDCRITVDDGFLQSLRILFKDDFLVLVDKPAGLVVHPPEDGRLRRFTSLRPTLIHVLSRQLKQNVYPVHRLDSATSGVLALALNSESARKLQASLQRSSTQKNYVALVRGFTDESGEITTPLSIDDQGEVMQEAHTDYESIFRFELPIPQGKHESARFSLVRVSLKTGRYHQIRRHFKRISHPLIGDTVHGDGRQNRIWRELTGDSLLYLKAYSLKFVHPFTHETLRVHSRWSGSWQKIFDRAGGCPFE